MPTEKLKQNLIGQLNSLQKAGINAIIFQVRPEADALYASRLEPWSRFLTGVQGKAPEPYWDPILCSAALDFYAVHYQTVFIVTGML